MGRSYHAGKHLLTVLFLAVLVITGLRSMPLKHAYAYFRAVLPSALLADTGSADGAAAAGTDTASGTAAEEPAFTVSDARDAFQKNLYMQDAWINLNGGMARNLNIRGLYKNLWMYILGDGYVVSGAAETSTDYEYEQITALKDFLDARDIQLLYVNAPTKYLDDQIFMDEFGLSCYSNQNADRFLQRIDEAGIKSLDLRRLIKKEGKNIYDMFYRTDHHWTVDSGLWAAEKAAKALNEDFDYHIDLSLYDRERYQETLYEECWLGEQGRKLAQAYVGLDDFVRIEPLFDTNLSMVTPAGGEVNGDFSIFVDDASYQFGGDVYHAPSMHYSYIRDGINQSKVMNQDVSEGRILLLADSYSQVVVPFLSLGVSEVDTLVLRGYDGSLQEFIDAGDYDTVVILYAQFMIGAHDNESSANYSMFNFGTVPK